MEQSQQTQKEHWGPCRLKSEVVYAICKFLHLRGDYKINIIHFTNAEGLRKKGHAWVTCDGKDLAITKPFRPEGTRLIGGNEKYLYWAAGKQEPIKAKREKAKS